VAVRRRIVARGRVQGVFFRDSTRRKAGSLGISGWARNREDGAVEVVAEGEPDAVEALVDYIRRGPGHAEVSDAEVTEEEPEGLSGFGTR
jgi:acylphosphatase